LDDLLNHPSPTRRNFLTAAAGLGLGACLPWTLSASAQSTETVEETQKRLAADPLRPAFHLLPQAGFLGDPCAPRFFDGKYHAFFHGSFGGRGWQHAISPDLVHWQHMPIALTPTAGGYDSYGTFTGGVLPGTGDDGTIIYTGVTKVPREQETIRNEGLREVQCIAVSSDKDLRSFTKLPKPVIDGPPAGMKVTGFRDPFGWKDGDTWYVGVGSGFNGVGGALLLFRSKDARMFEYVHTLAEGTWNGQAVSNPVGSAEMWECPDFFASGEKHVLLYSTEYKTFWEVGTFDREALKFKSELRGKLDYGNYYAPRSMACPDGRRVLWGWVQESRSREATRDAGWAGCMSLPRVLGVHPDGTLQQRPAPELDALLVNPRTLKPTHDSQALADRLKLLTLPSRAGRITAGVQTGAACTLRLLLEGSSQSRPLLDLACGKDDRGKDVVTAASVSVPLQPGAGGISQLDLWIDGSVLEIFVDQRNVLTTRNYELPDHVARVSLAWEGPAASLRSLQVASVAAISPDRLTT
jgi:beta-fructofuranosidase